MYEGCEKRLDVYFVCTDANAPGLCTLPFALWEAVARAAGAEILSQVSACYLYARVCACLSHAGAEILSQVSACRAHSAEARMPLLSALPACAGLHTR